MTAAVWVRCSVCGRDKAPAGRSVPMEMWSGLCSQERCKGYWDEPRPDCRWPGEETCGIGCTRGDE